MQIIPEKKHIQNKQIKKQTKDISVAINECNQKRMNEEDISNDWMHNFGSKLSNLKNNIIGTIQIKY